MAPAVPTHAERARPRPRWPLLLPTWAVFGGAGLRCAWTSVTGAAQSSAAVTFVPSGRRLNMRGCVTCRAFEPINRRDLNLVPKIERYIGQQVAIEGRWTTATTGRDIAKKKRKLEKLGLFERAKMLDKIQLRPWHIEHLAAGDVLEGVIQHDSLTKGQRVKFLMNITSPTTGVWDIPETDLAGNVKIEQDFSIESIPGERRNRDMAAWLMQKYNSKWRDFEGPLPSSADLERINLQDLRLFFKDAAQVDDFPSEEEYGSNCANPEKGMTLDEFLKYVLSDRDDYLASIFPTLYWGRRLKISDGSLTLEGDFQEKVIGIIVGFSIYEGKTGTFYLRLKGS